MWTRNPLTKRPIRVGGATHKKLVEIGVIKAVRVRKAGGVRKLGMKAPRKAGGVRKLGMKATRKAGYWLEGAQKAACYRQGANGLSHEKPRRSFCSFRTKSGMSVYGKCDYPQGYLTCEVSREQ